jgi:hypothetical protein
MFNNFISTLKTSVGKGKFWVKRNSPELLIFSGIILAAGSVVLAVFETKKLETITVPAKKKVLKLKEELSDSNAINNKEVDPEEDKNELRKVYAKETYEICKLYFPSFLSFSLAIICILGSHKILKGRNVALAAAYATLDSGYKAYRLRVAERFGKEVENEIYRDVRKDKVIVVDKDGNEVEKVLPVEHLNENGSGWAVIFDESNPNWESNSILNLEWLEMQEKLANQKLRANGYLFLSDVYKQLGIENELLPSNKIQGSHVVGWIYDPKDTSRDSYVSFGLRDRSTGEYTKRALEMKRHGERNIFIDFNVDGDILTGKIGDDGKPTRTFATRIKEIK